ncbi:MAG: hypothetical protein HY714_04540 [Candidatus Omnitrophica bacterium]|nr:hypothetical protein [Candidatus Omnitrophota bacterium]
MRRDEMLELWTIRFRRILDLEKNGFLFYRRLLKRYKLYFEGTRAKEVIEKIMRDEIRHVWLAKQLLALVKTKARLKS